MRFDDVKSWLNSQKDNLKDSVSRLKNKDFLDGVVAGCALVSAADGHIDASEKQKMVGFIQRSDELKVFDVQDVIKKFNQYTDGFEFDHTIGKGEALKAIIKLKGNQEASRLLVRVCCAIGMADGDFDADEKAVVREICAELGLDPNEFGLNDAANPSTPSSPPFPNKS